MSRKTVLSLLVAAAALSGVLAVLVARPREVVEPVPQLVAEARKLRDAGDYPGAVAKLDAAIKQDPHSVATRVATAEIYIDLTQPDAALGLLERAKQDGAPEAELVRPRTEAELITHRYEQVLRNTADIPADTTAQIKASLLAYRGSALAALGRHDDAKTIISDALTADPDSVDARVAQARLAMVSGRLDDARAELSFARRHAAADRRLLQLEADIAYLAKDFPGAAEIYQRILKAEPWNQLARGDLAAALLAEDKTTEAATTLDDVLNDPDLSDVPKDPMLSHIRSVVAFRQKDFSLAQEYSEYVVAHAPNYEPARIIAAASSYALGEYERANYYISPYVFAEPQDVLGRKLLAAIQLQLNHPREAATTLLPIESTGTNDPELLTLIGVASARSGDLPTANQYLKLAAQSQPWDMTVRAELGRTEIALGNNKAGIADLEEVAKASPDTLAPEVALFLAYVKTGEQDKAFEIANQIVAERPDVATGYLLVSSIDLMQGKVDAGRTALLKVREIHPGDVSANRNLAKLALGEGKPDEAKKYYEDILSTDPKDTRTYIELARLATRAEHVDEATQTLEKAVKANPNSIEANIILTRFQLALGKSQDALTTARTALQNAPRNPVLLDLVGDAQLDLGQKDEALSTFRDLVSLAPDASWAHRGLAAAYLAEYAPDRPQWSAITEASNAVQLDPSDQESKLVLARALLMHGRLIDANKVIESFSEQEKKEDVRIPELAGLVARGEDNYSAAAVSFKGAIAIKDNAIDRYRLADAQIHLGKPVDAENTLSDWLKQQPNDIDAHKALADLYQNSGQLENARKQYEALLQITPDNAQFHNNFAWILLRVGSPQEALIEAQQALKLDPDSVDALDTLGTILIANRQPDQAVTALRRAWANSSQRANIGYHLSEALAASGQQKEALRLLQGIISAGVSFDERAQAQQLLHSLGG